jgi:hypothetical protein
VKKEQPKKPAAVPEEEKPIPNFGVILEPKHPDEERIELVGADGQQYNITKDQAEHYLLHGLEDDSKKPCLTIIGDPATRAKVLSDLKGQMLADYARDYKIQAYPPGHWALNQGHQAHGNPTIYCQLYDGSVVHRQDGYTGPEPLLGALAAIRKRYPDYDPQKDPDRRPQPGPWPQPGPCPGPGPCPPGPNPNPPPSPSPSPPPNPDPIPQPYPCPRPNPWPQPSPQPWPGPQPRPQPGPNLDRQTLILAGILLAGFLLTLATARKREA